MDRSYGINKTMDAEFKCSNENQLGKFYSCQIERYKASAGEKIETFNMIERDIGTLIKRYTLKINELSE